MIITLDTIYAPEILDQNKTTFVSYLDDEMDFNRVYIAVLYGSDTKLMPLVSYDKETFTNEKFINYVRTFTETAIKLDNILK
jgi:hypothetical protein